MEREIGIGQKPLLSICIPTYNRASLLQEALVSILAQVNEFDRDKLEIVISDNSTNNETAAIVNKSRISSPMPIIYRKNEKNIGFDRNLLRVVELAHGEYCWLLGDDDLIQPGAIDLVLREIAANQQIDVFMGNKEDYDSNLSHRMRFVPLFRNNKDKIYDFHEQGLAQYFQASRKLICFFNYISILIIRRNKWLKVRDPEQFIGMGYMHVYMTMSILFSGDKGVLKYLAKTVARRRWSKDRIPNISERLHLDVEFFHLVARKVLQRRQYVRAIDRLVIKNDGFSWAVRSRINEGLDFCTRTFPFLFKYYWSYSLFWLKIFPLLFAPAVVLKLLRGLYCKFVKRENIGWCNVLRNDQSWERDELIRTSTERARFVARDEIAELKELLSNESADLNPHVASDLGIRRYIKSADRIKHYLPQGRILDWGCGLGQMAYLLKNRGFDVVSYDLDSGGRSFLERIGQRLLLARNPVSLPFPESHFDAVLSSGVLEHVADPLASLREINRILKNQGYLFIFMLPNKCSYIEYISDRLRRGDHSVKYSEKEIRGLLDKFNYGVISVTYKGLLPYNFKGFPVRLREYYHLFDKLIEKLDAILTDLPLLRLLSTNIEIVARKKGSLT